MLEIYRLKADKVRRAMDIDVSIVIPTYNKKDFLEITLVALGLQTYPMDKFEVVVINDGSTDQTEELVSSLSVPL